jgi:hypothetical protein
LDAKNVREAWSTVAAEGAEDEVFAFLVENQYSAEHVADLLDLSRVVQSRVRK